MKSTNAKSNQVMARNSEYAQKKLKMQPKSKKMLHKYF